MPSLICEIETLYIAIYQIMISAVEFLWVMILTKAEHNASYKNVGIASVTANFLFRKSLYKSGELDFNCEMYTSYAGHVLHNYKKNENSQLESQNHHVCCTAQISIFLCQCLDINKGMKQRKIFLCSKMMKFKAFENPGWPPPLTSIDFDPTRKRRNFTSPKHLKTWMFVGWSVPKQFVMFFKLLWLCSRMITGW